MSCRSLAATARSRPAPARRAAALSGARLGPSCAPRGARLTNAHVRGPLPRGGLGVSAAAHDGAHPRRPLVCPWYGPAPIRALGEGLGAVSPRYSTLRITGRAGRTRPGVAAGRGRWESAADSSDAIRAVPTAGITRRRPVSRTRGARCPEPARRAVDPSPRPYRGGAESLSRRRVSARVRCDWGYRTTAHFHLQAARDGHIWEVKARRIVEGCGKPLGLELRVKESAARRRGFDADPRHCGWSPLRHVPKAGRGPTPPVRQVLRRRTVRRAPGHRLAARGRGGWHGARRKARGRRRRRHCRGRKTTRGPGRRRRPGPRGGVFSTLRRSDLTCSSRS
jgi:hypothetical protein